MNDGGIAFVIVVALFAIWVGIKTERKKENEQ